MEAAVLRLVRRPLTRLLADLAAGTPTPSAVMRHARRGEADETAATPPGAAGHHDVPSGATQAPDREPDSGMT
jgi:hypothetical protein